MTLPARAAPTQARSRDERLNALREEIRATGKWIRVLRWTLVLSLFVLLPVGCLLVAYQAYRIGWMYLLALFPFTLPVAIIVRECRQRDRDWAEVRDHLASLPSSDRAAVLSSLGEEPVRETRRQVAAFRHEFGIRSEVMPAATPDGRGDEASAVQPAAPVEPPPS